MRFLHIIYAAALSGLAVAQNNDQRDGGNNQNNGDNGNNNAGTGTDGNAATGLTLEADAVQTGSQADGGNGGVADPGQSLSDTSDNNFINNCAGKTLTNGLQVEAGSCNGITMGDIPAKTNMVSSVITFPETGSDVTADTTFNISVQVANLEAGSFTNAQATYYSAPQALKNGKIVGHTHVTVQDMGNSLNPTQALDATKFAFFKGINDAGNGNGLLQAVVTGGLPAGNYRVCTMSSASNHQPVLMPVAQRGAQDDCTKFTVGAGNGNNGGNNADAGNNDDAGNNANAADDNANAGDDNATASSTSAATNGEAATSTTAAAAASSSAAAGTGNQGGNRGGNRLGGGNGRGGRGRGRKQRSRSFIE